MNIIKKILKLLTKPERKRLYMLFGFMVISGLIEVAGIASIMPFLALISDPGLIQDNIYLNWLYSALNFQSTNRFLLFVGLTVLIILILSNVLVFLTQWGLARFSWMRNYSISKRLLSSYLYQPYIFFLNRNTTVMGKNILSEVQHTIKGIFIPLLQMFSKGIVTIFIICLLVATEPLLALALIVILGSAYLFIYRLVRQRIYNFGKHRFASNSEQYKAVNKAFGDIKLVKLRRSEKYFIDSYSVYSLEFAKNNSTYEIISQIPRYIMEIIAFGGIIIVVLYFLATGTGFNEFLPIIGLYAFATYRLMPSLQAIFTGITSIRFNTEALNVLYDDIGTIKDKANLYQYDRGKIKPLTLKEKLVLENITFYYPETNKPVLKDLNIKININTSVAFVGETGVGKTTLANIILGLLRPDKGRMMVDGVEINANNLAAWQQNLGYIPQDIYLQDDTVARNIAFGISDDKLNMEAVEYSARIANIHDFIVKELPQKYQTLVGERGIRLSGGQRQRIGIARALYHNPEVLVLDEATSSLDGVTEKEVYTAILNIAKNKTLVIIAHRLTTIQECDVIYLMKHGEIIGKGRYEELMGENKDFIRIASAHLR